MKPSKDVFFSTANLPNNPYWDWRDYDYPTVPGMDLALNAAIVTLSTGPVAIEDGPNNTNRSLVMRSCREDGLLLTPEKPLTAIDAMCDGRRPPPGGFADAGYAQVWSTYSEISSGRGAAHRYHMLMSIDVAGPYALDPQLDLYPGLGSLRHVYFWEHDAHKCQHGVRAVHSGCVSTALPSLDDGSRPMTAVDSHQWSLLRLAPVLANGWVLLGELGKWVTASSKRFENLTMSDGGAVVALDGVAGEVVRLTALRPDADGDGDWIVVAADVACVGGLQRVRLGRCDSNELVALLL